MKKQLIWVFEWRKSVQYWWSYILFAPECKRVNLHARTSNIQVGHPTCCYQVCALDYAKGGTADLDYSLGPCHRNAENQITNLDLPMSITSISTSCSDILTSKWIYDTCIGMANKLINYYLGYIGILYLFSDISKLLISHFLAFAIYVYIHPITTSMG